MKDSEPYLHYLLYLPVPVPVSHNNLTCQCVRVDRCPISLVENVDIVEGVRSCASGLAMVNVKSIALRYGLELGLLTWRPGSAQAHWHAGPYELQVAPSLLFNALLLIFRVLEQISCIFSHSQVHI